MGYSFSSQRSKDNIIHGNIDLCIYVTSSSLLLSVYVYINTLYYVLFFCDIYIYIYIYIYIEREREREREASRQIISLVRPGEPE